jgi:hypothetical protein
MGLLDWLRDGLLGDRARMRQARETQEENAPGQGPDDPSGPHHFGRRAHRPDPDGNYGFGSGVKRRAGGL